MGSLASRIHSRCAANGRRRPARPLIPLLALLCGAAGCQGYSMEAVEPHTVVAVETYAKFERLHPPTLLVLQDRSTSMDACFDPQPGMGPTLGCMELPGLDTHDESRRSRMEVARQVMIRLIHRSQSDVRFGLVLFGADEEDPVCGGPIAVTEPAEDSHHDAIDAYASSPYLVQPRGGTPTTAALHEAYEILVDPETGRPRQDDRNNFVALVTDGLMNCNPNHPTPCVCASEGGCATDTPGVRLPFGELGEPANGSLCLDDDEAVAAIQRLHDAGVRTFVIGLGEVFGDDGEDGLARSVLDRLAEAGGVARQEEGEPKFYSAANPQELQESLETIVRQISAPCAYELDGPICDGRLLQLSLRIDGEEIETSCSEEEVDGEATWFFAEREDGSGLDPQRIVFSSAICERLEATESAEILIRGVENACPDEGDLLGPACSLAETSED